MEEIAELTGSPPADVLGHVLLLHDVQAPPVREAASCRCARTSRCLVTGGPEILEHLEQRYAADADVTVEEVECLAACGGAPAMQVNYEFHEQLTAELGARRSSTSTRRARARRARSREPPWLT